MQFNQMEFMITNWQFDRVCALYRSRHIYEVWYVLINIVGLISSVGESDLI